MMSPPLHTRKSIIGLLWCFAFLSYLLRMNIAVAQQSMARELSLSDVQVGWVFTAFLIGYSIFQLPGGMLGDRFSSRLVLGICGLAWVVTTALTGLLPGRISLAYLGPGASAALAILIALRFLHGIAEAPTYPVAMTALSEWFPARQYALISALIFTGSTAGSAVAPPVVAHMMIALGWRATFYLTAILPLGVAVLWFWRTKEIPRTPIATAQETGNWWYVVKTRNVFFLCLSYFLYCYSISIFVYWLFKYLVDVRHLSIVNSGWAASLPWIAASILLPIIGYLSTQLSNRIGFLQGRRLVAAACLMVASILLYVGASATDIKMAIGAIAISVGLLFSTESSYFSTAIAVSGRNAGAASGVMNLAGNLGGVAATGGVPLLVLHFGWLTALLSGSAIAILAALTWFGLQPSQSRKEPALALPVPQKTFGL